MMGALTAAERTVEPMSDRTDVTDATPPTAPPAFDSKRFRSVLGPFPTSVTVVTAIDRSNDRYQPVGLTIGSFVSVSLDPPLVGFLPQTDSDTWTAIERSGSFVVNELNCNQGDLCWRFAKSGNEDERFDGVGWRESANGSPILDQAVAWIDCTVESVHEMGDHYFVLGRVHDLDADTPDGDEAPLPLIFYKGMLGRFQPEG